MPSKSWFIIGVYPLLLINFFRFKLVWLILFTTSTGFDEALFYSLLFSGSFCLTNSCYFPTFYGSSVSTPWRDVIELKLYVFSASVNCLMINGVVFFRTWTGSSVYWPISAPLLIDPLRIGVWVALGVHLISVKLLCIFSWHRELILILATWKLPKIIWFVLF